MKTTKGMAIAMASLAMATGCSEGDMVEDNTNTLEMTLSNMTKLGAEASSGHLLVPMESESFSRDGTPRCPSRTQIEVWFDGVRVREEIRTTEGANAEETLWLFDGERVIRTSPPAFETALVGFPRRLDDLGRYGIWSLGSSLIDWQLSVILYRLPSLGVQLPQWSAGPLRVGGEEMVSGISCQLIEVLPIATACDQTIGQRLWIAREKGYAVARFEQDVETPAPESVSRLVTIDEATDWLHPVEGLWLPRLVTTTKHYTDRATGARWLGHRKDVEIITAEFNVEIPDAVFKLELPEGTEIIPFDADERN